MESLSMESINVSRYTAHRLLLMHLGIESMPVDCQKVELLTLTTEPTAAQTSLGLFIKALKCPTGRGMENSAGDIFYNDLLEFLI